VLEDSIWLLEYLTKVPLDPSNNFRNVYNVYYHNKDSIFVYDESNAFSEYEDLFLINFKGDIVNSISVLNDNQADPFITNKLHAISTPTFFYRQSKIYMSNMPNLQADRSS
jgi:hypothetical protein